MGLSLNTPGAAPVPSSYGQPLMPVTLPGTLAVPFGEVPQFLKGFPVPRGVPDLVEGFVATGNQLARTFNEAAANGDFARVLGTIAEKTLEAAPVVGGLIGGVVSASGVVAGVLGPILGTAIPQPYGAVVGTVLEVYAPIASVGGQAVAGLSSVARGTAAVAQAAAQQQQAAGGMGPQP